MSFIYSKKILFSFSVLLFVIFFGTRVHSQEFSSSNYKVLDPVINSGSHGSSTSFRIFGVLSQIGPGTSTSATYGNNAEFLYFPTVNVPILFASPGDAQVSLS